MHVDDFVVDEKARYDQFIRGLDKMVPAKNLGELHCCLGGVYDMDWDEEVQTPAKQLADEHTMELGKSVPLPVGTKLEEFEKNKAPGGYAFRELVDSEKWSSTHSHPNIYNAVRSVARYIAAPTLMIWRAALGILRYMRRRERCCYGGNPRIRRVPRGGHG